MKLHKHLRGNLNYFCINLPSALVTSTPSEGGQSIEENWMNDQSDANFQSNSLDNGFEAGQRWSLSSCNKTKQEWCEHETDEQCSV